MPIIIALASVFAVMIVLYLVLYYLGVLTINNKTAEKFIADGSHDGSYFHAVIKGCRGSIKKIIRFREGGEVTLKLDTELTFGKITVTLRDKSAAKDYTLTREPKDTYDKGESAVSFNALSGKPYALSLSFENADGEFWLYIKTA